jgi:hypothetical protein
MYAAMVLAMALGADPTIALGTGAKMCEALVAADFKAVGLSPDPVPPRPPNSTEPTGAYCTYTQAFPIRGGIEFDIFDGESDPKGVFQTTLGESGPTQPAGLAGVDESVLNLAAPGDKGHKMALLVVRHRRLVFVITIPSGPKAKEQLVSLAQVVLGRVKH